MKNRLRVLRAQREWSQADLAERLEVSRQSVNAIETGKFDPSLPLAFKLARLFGTTIERIFVDEERGSPSQPATAGSPRFAGVGGVWKKRKNHFRLPATERSLRRGQPLSGASVYWIAHLELNCGSGKMLCPAVRFLSDFYPRLRAPVISFSFFFILVATGVRAQSPIRIIGPVDDSSRAVLPQSHLSLPFGAKEIAPLDSQQNLDHMVLAINLAPRQQADLKALLDSQQTRGSQNFHAWLTPEEFFSLPSMDNS